MYPPRSITLLSFVAASSLLPESNALLLPLPSTTFRLNLIGRSAAAPTVEHKRVVRTAIDTAAIRARVTVEGVEGIGIFAGDDPDFRRRRPIIFLGSLLQTLKDYQYRLAVRASNSGQLINCSTSGMTTLLVLGQSASDPRCVLVSAAPLFAPASSLSKVFHSCRNRQGTSNKVPTATLSKKVLS